MATVQHSNYWLDKDLFNDDADTVATRKGETDDLATVARYAAVRRAISNFVSILSGKNIPVEYSSGKDSYTDGERVVIAAEDDPEKFDVMVGLALHEASHVLLTKFDFLKSLEHVRAQYRAGMKPYSYTGLDFAQTIFPASLTQLFPEPQGPGPAESYDDYAKVVAIYARKVTQAFDDVQMLMNILEDRRIDKWVFTRAGGYRPYYQALYNRYFFTAEVGKNLRFNPEWREITVENYITRLLYSFHPAAKPDAMPGLDKLIDMMDLANIDRIAPEHDKKGALDVARWTASNSFEDTPVLWQEACHLYAGILALVAQRVAPEKEQAEGFDPVPSLEDALAELLKDNPTAGNSLPNLDLNGPAMPMPVEMDTKGKGKNQKEVEGKFNSKKAEKDKADAKKVMNGEVKKKKMTKQMQASVTALEEAAGEMVDISGNGIPKAKCLVTRKLTDKLLEQDWFIFGGRWSSDYSKKAIAAGKRMGQILHHRLQVRNDPLMTKQTRLAAGGMDRRLLAQLGMEITNVFQKSRIDTHKPAMLHLSLDASGSMSGTKWSKVQTVATALAYLGSKLRNVDTVISIRGGNQIPVVAVVFDSRKDQIVNFYRMFEKIAPAGATPEGLCYKATMDLITECTATHDVYFINFSDGEPSFYVTPGAGIAGGKNNHYGLSYAGDVATKHTRQMVQMMKEKGVKILSYFISDADPRYQSVYGSNAMFKKMYGEDASFVNVSNAGEVLITLNRLLRERGT